MLKFSFNELYVLFQNIVNLLLTSPRDKKLVTQKRLGVKIYGRAPCLEIREHLLTTDKASQLAYELQIKEDVHTCYR